MNEMMERAARAVASELGLEWTSSDPVVAERLAKAWAELDLTNVHIGGERLDLIGLVRVVLSAIRKPTLDVFLAGFAAQGEPGELVTIQWQAMIDAVLAETP